MIHALATAVLALTTITVPVGAERSAPEPGDVQVLVISVDGLNAAAIDRLGASGTPTFHRLLDEGAGTLNARTEFEQTDTLPNHTSMMTGRRIAAAKGGHGVTWDDDRRSMTVQKAAGHGVASIFSVVHADGGTTALYTTKEKFGLFKRSWPRGIDTFTEDENQKRLVSVARADLRDGAPTLTFLHVSLPDRTGHAYGGMSARYLGAVRRTDAQLGTILDVLAGSPVTVILTADHGFATGASNHSARRDVGNYRVPFLTWGAGVDHADLYELNPGYRDPGTARPSYAGKQPVRNGDVANLAASLLGLDAVPGSTIDSDLSLTTAR